MSEIGKVEIGETAKRTKKTRQGLFKLPLGKTWGMFIVVIVFIAVIAVLTVVMPNITAVDTPPTPAEADVLNPASGEVNTPLVANATETPESIPTVIATETSEAEPTDSGSNVVFVTPTPKPTPTPIPEGTMLVPLDIPVTLEGADPKDVEMNLYYTGVSIKGDVEYLPKKDVWIDLQFYPFGIGPSYYYMNEFAFEFAVDVNRIEIDRITAYIRVVPHTE